MRNAERIQCLHPDPQKSAPSIEKWKYECIKSAILQTVRSDPQGIYFKDLPDQVWKLLTDKERNGLGSVSWYTVTVKLDLEAHDLIERVPGVKPQRLRIKI